MGNLHSAEYAQMAEAGLISLTRSIEIHLQSNHFPPVPLSMVGACVEAIEACIDEDTDRLITLPEGVSWRNQQDAPAWAIVEGHHLEAWAYEPE
jgi:hypothetical protein